MSNRLEVRGVSKAFGGIQALDAVDLDVRDGEILAVIGPNGSGKTTLFNVITGVLPADAGSVTLRGEELLGLRPDQIRRRGLSRTFQTLELFPALTLEEHILIGMQANTRTNLLAACFGMPSVRRQERELRAQTHKGFGPFGDRLTADRYNDRADSLSYANRRRLEIARALAAEPEVLLLDEPAAGMNPHERAQLTSAIGHQRDQGQTILLIEHHMELVTSVSDRVVALDHGQKIAEGTPREVVDNPLVVEAYLGT